MKILHTADWHLGKRLDRFSRLQEQREVLDELIQIANKEVVDVVLIAGDLFDAFNPSSEAVELLYQSLKRLTNGGKRLVVAIAGNHDSPDRIDAPDPLARECGILFAGYPDVHLASGEICNGIRITKSEPGFLEVQFPQYAYPLRLLLTPYANEYRLKTYLGEQGEEEEELRQMLAHYWLQLANRYCDAEGVNVLMAHLFVMKKGETPPEEPEDEKPILHIGGAQAIYSEHIPNQIQYVALGHLHRYQQIDKQRMPIVYSSSILSYSFAEAGQQKNVILAELQPGKQAQFTPIPLHSGKPLYRKRFESIQKAVSWLQEHQDTWVELTIVSDQYMHADERKQLYQVHDGIVTIIPEVGALETNVPEAKAIDLSQSIEELFVQYFTFKYGSQPNPDILTLFKEIRAEEITE